MAAPDRSLAILDVGHGNCAVLRDRRGVVVIDAGPGSSLLEFLTEHKITNIDVSFFLMPIKIISAVLLNC